MKYIIVGVSATLLVGMSMFKSVMWMDNRLSTPEMAVLYGGEEEKGKCCQVIAECRPLDSQSCNNRNPCEGDALVSTKAHNTRCGVTPPGIPDSTWACANHDSGIGDPSICAYRKYCVLDGEGTCVHGAKVPDSDVTGQWLCEQSKSCKTQPAPPPEDP